MEEKYNQYECRKYYDLLSPNIPGKYANMTNFSRTFKKSLSRSVTSENKVIEFEKSDDVDNFYWDILIIGKEMREEKRFYKMEFFTNVEELNRTFGKDSLISINAGKMEHLKYIKRDMEAYRVPEDEIIFNDYDDVHFMKIMTASSDLITCMKEALERKFTICEKNNQFLNSFSRNDLLFESFSNSMLDIRVNPKSFSQISTLDQKVLRNNMTIGGNFYQCIITSFARDFLKRPHDYVSPLMCGGSLTYVLCDHLENIFGNSHYFQMFYSDVDHPERFENYFKKWLLAYIGDIKKEYKSYPQNIILSVKNLVQTLELMDKYKNKKMGNIPKDVIWKT
jgi:hypothetical protein